MTRTTVGILAGLGLAAAVSSRLESAPATGVLAGYLFGGSLGLLGLAWQRHVIRTEPARAFSAMTQSFLFKLVGVLGGVLAARFIVPVSAVADWKSFAVAYAAAVLVCLVLGSFEIQRELAGRMPRPLPEPVKGETAR